MEDTTTIVVSKDTRKMISHLKYELGLRTYDDTIRALIEGHYGKDKYGFWKRYLGVEK